MASQPAPAPSNTTGSSTLITGADMPADAPAVGAKLRATMSQPIRKGVAKWTDVIRKLAVRDLSHRRGNFPAVELDMACSCLTQVGEECEVLETQLNPENKQIR